MNNQAQAPRPFDWKRLSSRNFANGVTDWHYKHIGTSHLDLTSPGFFAEATEIRPGDTITATVFDLNEQFMATGDLVCVDRTDEGPVVLIKGKFVYAPANDVNRAAA